MDIRIKNGDHTVEMIGANCETTDCVGLAMELWHETELLAPEPEAPGAGMGFQTENTFQNTHKAVALDTEPASVT
jgi:hypothetical protein